MWADSLYLCQNETSNLAADAKELGNVGTAKKILVRSLVIASR
jgi:hypothetical protein